MDVRARATRVGSDVILRGEKKVGNKIKIASIEDGREQQRQSNGQRVSSFFTKKTRQSSGSNQEFEREASKTIYYQALCVDAGLLERPWR
ncbi:unnamed protein product [Dovyalis caffra]|uniref:Uncharacterized protein n=1 Tax=Dovyalis caffra TaxID=77055 RepID=A0AAV1SCY4_9ROSI|nr:unnamed protein product [Dovyalis caffra]